MSVRRAAKSLVMARSRAKKVAHFYSMSCDQDRILDVGVSTERSEGPAERNYFLKTFRYPSDNYTGLGIQDLSEMEALFPGKRFVQYSGGRFPFGDKDFDWVFSNAVIEHVGDESAQREFVNEMLRVAKNVYFTTPYKYFPLETHTNLICLHWIDRMFARWLEKHRPESGKYSIYLFSIQRLRRLLKASDAAEFILHKNRFAGIVMTLTVVCR